MIHLSFNNWLGSPAVVAWIGSPLSLAFSWRGTPNDWWIKSHRILSDVWPRSAPALELHSRAESNVGVTYCSSSSNTGSNPGGGRILKKNYLGTTEFCVPVSYLSKEPFLSLLCWILSLGRTGNQIGWVGQYQIPNNQEPTKAKKCFY